MRRESIVGVRKGLGKFRAVGISRELISKPSGNSNRRYQRLGTTMFKVDSLVFTLAWGVPTLGHLWWERRVYLQFIYLSAHLPIASNGKQGGNKIDIKKK